MTQPKEKITVPQSAPSIGRYQLIRSIAKGGMGEVFLAYDPLAEREVALKVIRPELFKYPSIKERFLKEAKIAATLTHPAVIPIYAIYESQETLYYTMPFIEGDTLKEMLNQAKREDNDLTSLSLPALMRVFLTLCQTIAYAHSKEILHRDIKPENIIVGTFGEVILIDWGLAQKVHDSPEKEENIPDVQKGLTRPGKVVGTLSFMAPERVLGKRATFQSDIYSLGVMLYQILTLTLPFKRPSLKLFLKRVGKEPLIDPIEIAPHRDIPKQLADAAKKCLQFDPQKRYQAVSHLIEDLEKVIEGHPDWIEVEKLHLEKKEEWSFQENVLFSKQMAITQSTEVAEWMALMVSRRGYRGNIQLKTTITLKKMSHGIGLALSLPTPHEGYKLEEGLFVWIGSETHPGITLYRSNVEVLHFDRLFLPEKKCTLTFEKSMHSLRLFIEDKLLFDFPLSLPTMGTHVACFYKDTLFTLSPLTVSVGSQNATIPCLAIPEAFLMVGDFDNALFEYEKIAASFEGRNQGRQALFQMGLTLIEKGKREEKKKTTLFSKARKVFEKLHLSPSAPLEYLGKATLCKEEKDIEEEIKYFQIALRKYKNHPLFPMIKEEVFFRLHETAQRDRKGAYLFSLLTLRHIDKLNWRRETKSLLKNVKKHLEPFPFFVESDKEISLAIHLSFLLNKPLLLIDILENDATLDTSLKRNLLLSLATLDYPPSLESKESYYEDIDPLFSNEPLPVQGEKLLQNALKNRSIESLSPLLVFATRNLTQSSAPLLIKLLTPFENSSETVTPLLLFCHLFMKSWEEAKRLFSKYEKTTLSEPTSLLYTLYGCFLFGTKDEKRLAHFSNLTPLSSPPSYLLLGYFLNGSITLEKTNNWNLSALPFEKIQLFQQLSLFFHLTGDTKQANAFEKKWTGSKKG